MNYIPQPTSLTCTQTSLAMVLNTTVPYICELIAHEGACGPQEINRVLKFFGIAHSTSQSYCQGGVLPELALVFIKKKGYTQTAVYLRGKIYDPQSGIHELGGMDGVIARFIQVDEACLDKEHDYAGIRQGAIESRTKPELLPFPDSPEKQRYRPLYELLGRINGNPSASRLFECFWLILNAAQKTGPGRYEIPEPAFKKVAWGKGALMNRLAKEFALENCVYCLVPKDGQEMIRFDFPSHIQDQDIRDWLASLAAKPHPRQSFFRADFS